MINELCKAAHAIAVAVGWWDEDRNFGEQIALMHSELSEALEEWRAHKPIAKLEFEAPDGSRSDVQTEMHRKPVGVPSEFADVIIRIANVCGRYGVDLDEAVRVKMLYNETRPYKHGNKLA